MANLNFFAVTDELKAVLAFLFTFPREELEGGHAVRASERCGHPASVA